ncbi:MAG TPA: hypothetical protein VNS58_31340 [Puia sp.]|nr:hypothetical protein [Puia sp.]
MKKAIWIYFSVLVVSPFYSCQSDHKASLAIRDFDKSLQPFLTKAVSTGIVGFDEATVYIEKHTKDGELILLSRSEHPILRAIAFREILSRPAFDHFSVIMNHLDDTAFVAVDKGEWGIQYRTISDYIIEEGRWKTIDDRKRTVDEIIMKHDNLRAAYTGLRMVELQEKYYPHIREMAQRERLFEEREEALYRLAKYKRRSDIPLIKQALLENDWRMGDASFGLMRDFPDTSYMEVLRTYYYHRRFYRSICHDGWGDVRTAVEYISTLAMYKSDSSVKILKLILNRKPLVPCAADTNSLREHLLHSIWDNACPAYADLRKQIRVDISNIIKRDSINERDFANNCHLAPVVDSPKDTAAEPVRW